MRYIPLLFCFLFFEFIINGCSKKTQNALTTTSSSPATPKAGKSFYVSEIVGVDVNNGLSSSTPFKTINFALNSAEAGDTVFIMDGTYTSPVNITKSGAKDKFITIKAYTGHSPKIFYFREYMECCYY